MTKIRYNLYSLKKQLEINAQSDYTWDKIALDSNVHRNTLLNMANDKTRRIDLDIMGRLIDYFASEGMPVTPNDLFVVEPDEVQHG